MKSAKNKKSIKMIFFDMDGVLFDTKGYKENSEEIALSSWNILFQEMGIYSEHERLKKMYLEGIFPSYMEWTDEACRVLQNNGLNKKIFKEVLERRPFMKGARETFKELRKGGYKTGVITGGFDFLAQRAKIVLGLDYVSAHCKFFFDQKGEIKKWELIPCDFEAKAAYFKKIADKESISYSECAYVGHDINDVAALGEAGLSIAFNASKKKTREASDIIIERKDLREILKYFPKINK